MYRFFADQFSTEDGRIYLSGKDVNHIRNVLRMRAGDQLFVVLTDGWEYICRIEEITEKLVICRIEDAQKAGRELSSSLVLYQCLPKGDKMDLIIQKATELGAVRMVPVASARSIVRLDEKKKEARTRRWRRVAEAAAKQSGRLLIPEISPVLSFEEMLKDAQKNEIRLMPYEKAAGMAESRRILFSIRPGQSVGILIGPEGGFEESEAQKAEEAGFSLLSLGKRILRCETAGMTTLSILMYLLEEDG